METRNAIPWAILAGIFAVSLAAAATYNAKLDISQPAYDTMAATADKAKTTIDQVASSLIESAVAAGQAKQTDALKLELSQAFRRVYNTNDGKLIQDAITALDGIVPPEEPEGMV